MRKAGLIGVIVGMSLLLCACNSAENLSQKNGEQEKNASESRKSLAQEEAENTPFGRYEETVTYTLGKITGSNNSNMPSGDTYENNAYTRYLRKKINIQNKDAYEVSESGNYLETISLSILNNRIPDVMVINDINTLRELVEEDKIEDLTQVYQKCASDRVKEIYQSYGEEILENVTFDGKMMALPETNIDAGPSLLWLRKDWKDKLGLDAPKTMKDVERIVQAFIKEDPGENGPGETIGLACDSDLAGNTGYSSEYQMDLVFAGEGAFPKQWIRGKDGKVCYGSVQPEVKKALARLRKMYRDGTIDRNFLLRGDTNIIEIISEGKCGAFFGPWWAPNNPLMKVMEKNPDAEWAPYRIATDADGSTKYAIATPSTRFVVVRKGYEHPEIIMKIVSVLFDKIMYEDKEAGELAQCFQDNVDPTARPLAINVDYQDALSRCYQSLRDALTGKKDVGDLTLLEGAYYEGCYRYQQNGIQSSWEDWAAYTSRITACSVLDDDKIQKVSTLFYGKTDTMQKKWWKLEKMEKEAYLKIVTGDRPLSYFDRFVREWKREGGDRITREVREYLEIKHK